MYDAFQNLFDIPEGVTFSAFFEQEVRDFKNATKDFDDNKVLNLVSDPMEQ